MRIPIFIMKPHSGWIQVSSQGGKPSILSNPFNELGKLGVKGGSLLPLFF